MSYLIALDDGHGSQTPGKRTPVIPELGRAIKENEFNKAAVYYLGAELRKCGFRILLVAAGDSDVPLSIRTNRANAGKADAYIRYIITLVVEMELKRITIQEAPKENS